MNVIINEKKYYIEKTKSEKYYIECEECDNSLLKGETYTYTETGKVFAIEYIMKITGTGRTYNINENKDLPERLLKRVYLELKTIRTRLVEKIEK